MTTLQEMIEHPLKLDSLVPIIPRSTKGLDQVAAFVALTVHHKMELGQWVYFKKIVRKVGRYIFNKFYRYFWEK